MQMDEQTRMIRDTVRKFVEREMIPLEPHLALQEVSDDDGAGLTDAQFQRLREVSKELGLWGLDAPEEFGGLALPYVTMAAVWEEVGRTFTPFIFPPDTPNLRMMAAVGSPEQKEKYLKPYIEGRMTSAICISEPGAGGDPAGITTRAVQTADGWVLNGRKIWITNARRADFMITMARVGDGARQEGITAFIVEKGTPGLNIQRAIPMVSNALTYELTFDDMLLPEGAVLGQVGQGYAPMQLRLITRRLEMSARSIGMATRCLDILCEHARQRVTFGERLADRQAIQWWVADLSTRIHAARLMVNDTAEKVDLGEDVRHEASMIKVFCTELAYEAADHAMQTLGAMGMTKELPLYHLWQRARVMRIYEGPSEVHRQTIARRVLGGKR